MRISDLVVFITLALVVSAGPLGKGPAKSPAKSPATPAANLPASNSKASNQGKSSAPNKKAPSLPSLKGLPPGTKVVAFDEDKGHYHAFDHKMTKLGSVPHPDGKKKSSSGSSTASSKTDKKDKKDTTSAPKPAMKKQKRDTNTCTNLSKDDVQKCRFSKFTTHHPLIILPPVPGWKDILATAQKNWGTGSYNLATNPDDVRSAFLPWFVQIGLTSLSTKTSVPNRVFKPTL
jgi:hypothetical protein